MGERIDENYAKVTEAATASIIGRVTDESAGVLPRLGPIRCFMSSGNRLLRRYDISGDLGGRIIRDKLWFYGALRRMDNQFEILNARLQWGSAYVDSAIAERLRP